MTQWYAIVDAAGDLVSTGTVVADDAHLAVNGLTKIALAADPNGLVWDKPTQTFVVPPPAPVVLTPYEFISRFTAVEFMAISASTDPNVQFYLLKLARTQEVIPSDAVVQQGLAYLVSLGLLTQARATEIGAG